MKALSLIKRKQIHCAIQEGQRLEHAAGLQGSVHQEYVRETALEPSHMLKTLEDRTFRLYRWW